MQFTSSLLITLATARLSIAAPQSIGNTSPLVALATPDEYGAAILADGVASPVFDIPTMTLTNTTTTVYSTVESTVYSTAHPTVAARYNAFGADKRRMRYCQHSNGQGACINQDIQTLKCYNFGAWWNDRVSSIYVNPHTLCLLYDKANCKGRYVEVRHPGHTNLQTVNMNDKASSFWCDYADID